MATARIKKGEDLAMHGRRFACQGKLAYLGLRGGASGSSSVSANSTSVHVVMPYGSMHVEMVGDTITHLKGSFKGPDATPYEGGVFEVDIEITTEYPFKPPKMKCELCLSPFSAFFCFAKILVLFAVWTSANSIIFAQSSRKCTTQMSALKLEVRIFSPGQITVATFLNLHINSIAAICLDILKDQWSPVLTLKTALISLQSLMSDPAADNPQDAQVARHYLSDRKGFDDTAREWTRTYAGATVDPDAIDPSIDQAVLGRLMDMGFDKKQAAAALKKCGGDENRAIESLLG
ncbi:Ubiquitin-conjugating enzyme E2 27 [Chytriomyces hyalinus]|nr:Ubiquitin-conjugating enzyme E2 27 [Chytriomyces hyalinus]